MTTAIALLVVAASIVLSTLAAVRTRDVLAQVRRPRFVAADSMNFWISGKPESLRQTLRLVDTLLINDAETRQLANEVNLVQAARRIPAASTPGLV